ncbi:cell envelope integrity protein TolA [Colwellia sp. D2M02]|uniref:cell envelope integrity protein TolA n=1 Tax=Colwellia sp. D2M02 TaxID=2841562 RepID=UPI00339D759D
MNKQSSNKPLMKSSYAKALWLSVGLHVALLVTLFIGDFNATSKPVATPTPSSAQIEPIKAVVVDKAKYDQAINKIKKQKADDAAAEKKRIKAIERRADEAKQRRAKEEARIKKLEIQRKKKEQEKIQADKAAKSAKAKADQAEKVRKQKEQEKQKAEQAAATARAKRIKEEAEAKKAEELRKKKLAEQKRKEKEAKEKAAQQAAEQALIAEQMAAEMAARNKARSQQVMTEIQRFSALITQSINRNMIKDRSTMVGKTCRLTISLASSGFVTNVSVGKGDKVVCDAAETAIYKTGTLPVSQDPEVFKEMRKIAVTVVPDFS